MIIERTHDLELVARLLAGLPAEALNARARHPLAVHLLVFDDAALAGLVQFRPAGELDGWRDDAAEWIGPADDRNLGLQKIWKYYYLEGLHQQTDVGQVIFNQQFWNSLPPDLQEIIRVAVKATVAETFDSDIYDNSVALHQLEEKDGVHVLDTPKDYYPKFIAASDKVTAEYAAKNPFFKKVLDSEINFAKMVYPYRKRVLELYFNMVKTAHKVHP